MTTKHARRMTIIQLPGGFLIETEWPEGEVIKEEIVTSRLLVSDRVFSYFDDGEK